MDFKNILVLGGAGFVGSSIAKSIKQRTQNVNVTAFDNLMRRGSELNLSELRRNGINYIHGDTRVFDDLSQIKKCDLIITAPPNRQYMQERKDHLGQSSISIFRHLNCMEYAKKKSAAVIFINASKFIPFRSVKD